MTDAIPSFTPVTDNINKDEQTIAPDLSNSEPPVIMLDSKDIEIEALLKIPISEFEPHLPKWIDLVAGKVFNEKFEKVCAWLRARNRRTSFEVEELHRELKEEVKAEMKKSVNNGIRESIKEAILKSKSGPNGLTRNAKVLTSQNKVTKPLTHGSRIGQSAKKNKIPDYSKLSEEELTVLFPESEFRLIPRLKTIIKVFKEWYEPEPPKLSIEERDRKHSDAWRKVHPRDSLYRERKKIIQFIQRSAVELKISQEELAEMLEKYRESNCYDIWDIYFSLVNGLGDCMLYDIQIRMQRK